MRTPVARALVGARRPRPEADRAGADDPGVVEDCSLGGLGRGDAIPAACPPTRDRRARGSIASRAASRLACRPCPSTTRCPTATSRSSSSASPRPGRSPPRGSIGRGDKEAADQAAVDAMRAVLGSVQMDGIVVIGEGEKDEAPMLYNGERVGDGSSPRSTSRSIRSRARR